MPFEDRDEHQQNTCIKRWVPCKWDNCEGTSADRLETHENNECGYREITCICNKIVLGRDHINHLKNHCRQRMVDCRHKKCTMRIIYSERALHEKTDCQQRWVSCMFRDVPKTTELKNGIEEIGEEDYTIVEELASALNVKNVESLDSRLMRIVGCGARVKLNEMEEHWEKNCLSRNVLCGAGCGVTFVYGNTTHHKTNTCIKREVICKLGCMQKTLFENMKEHEERKCKFRMTTCSFGCGSIMIEYERKKHEKNECKFRFVDCTNKCGLNMRYEDLNYHLIHSCDMREYTPPPDDYQCKRCSFENKSNVMLEEYGQDVYAWKCQVCKAPAYQKGMKIGASKKFKSKGGGMSSSLFGT